MNIIEYKVCRNDCIAGINEMVQDLISKGWQPYGYLLTPTSVSYGWVYVQVMVKYA